MSFFLVFLAIALLGAALAFGVGIARTGRSFGAGLDEPVPNLPPVLLPANATAPDVDRVRFALGLRGYRMDQVDQVLDELRELLAAKDREIERLGSLRDKEAEPVSLPERATEPVSLLDREAETDGTAQ